MNRIETIIQKFDINPCTLSLPEAREYLYHLHEQSKPFKNKELSAEAQKEFNDILDRLKITRRCKNKMTAPGLTMTNCLIVWNKNRKDWMPTN